MTSSLFRAQALGVTQHQGVGEMVFYQPLSLRFASIVLLMIVLALLSFAALAPISQTELVRGHLQASQGSLRVFSSAAGTVAEIVVNNGDIVRAGDVLATVRSAAFDASGRLALSHSIAQVQAQLRQETAMRESLLKSALLNERSLRQRTSAVHNELLNMGEQLAALTRRRELSMAQVRRQEVLLEKRQTSVQQHEGALDTLYSFEQSIQGLHAQKDSRFGVLLALEQELAQIPFLLQQQLAASDSKIAQLQRSLKELETSELFSLTAPADGVVNNVLSWRGAAVDSRTPFANIVPLDTEFEVLLFVPSRALGKVKEQQLVFLDYDSYPAQTYGYAAAQIVEISQALLDPREHLFPVQMQEPFYLVKAAPQWGSWHKERAQNMRSGMQFTAHLVVGEQTLLEKLLAPLKILRERV